MTALVAKGIELSRGSRRILAGVDLQLRAGEVVLLAGRNGAGKSTLLRVLLGSERAASGTVQLGGRDLAAWPPRERAREIAYVPQEGDHPFEFTGRELVAMGRHPHLHRDQPPQLRDLEAIERALVAVGATDFADRSVATLSGGEQRRIAIARALATEAKLLLLDEPTSNLDLEHALQLVHMLRDLRGCGVGVLLTAHDLNLVAPHCDRVALLHDGRICADDVPTSALTAERVLTVFGVRAEHAAGYFPRDFRL
ncbi:MAG: ABC transporter ATP-binding protein [Planctomycetes bacterium]|nr:ABC transporter ATP-binding protein [Planctomycetota bacterium]